MNASEAAPTCSPPTDDYDWETDAKACWALGLEIARDMMRAGKPVPAMYRSQKT